MRAPRRATLKIRVFAVLTRYSRTTSPTAASGRTNAVKALLARGADPNVSSKWIDLAKENRDRIGASRGWPPLRRRDDRQQAARGAGEEDQPGAESKIVAAGDADAHVSQPYPFYLAYGLESELESLGDAREWQAEWKWDGIRAQVIRRGGEVSIWSRGEELVTERFPEIASTAQFLPDGTVLDGEIMPWRSDAPLPFAQLQRRIGRRTVGAKLLSEVPVVLIAYDVLEHGGWISATPGHAFVEQGEPGDAFYVIGSGQVTVLADEVLGERDRRKPDLCRAGT